MKYLISGGGTGGHIFPAVSIANALREADPPGKSGGRRTAGTVTGLSQGPCAVLWLPE